MSSSVKSALCAVRGGAGMADGDIRVKLSLSLGLSVLKSVLKSISKSCASDRGEGGMATMDDGDEGRSIAERWILWCAVDSELEAMVVDVV